MHANRSRRARRRVGDRAGDRLLRIDRGSGAAAPGACRVERAYGVVADGDGAWAIAEDPRQPRARCASRSAAGSPRGVPIPAAGLDGLAAGAGAVWATAPAGRPAVARDRGRGALDRRRSGCAGRRRGRRRRLGGERCAGHGHPARPRRRPRRPRSSASATRRARWPRTAPALWVTVAAGGGAPARDAGRSVAGAVAVDRVQRGGGGRRGTGAPDRVRPPAPTARASANCPT